MLLSKMHRILHDSDMVSEDNDLFYNLTTVVQYSRKDIGDWLTMAAFDSKSIAEKYAKNCSSDNCPWDYRTVEINGIAER